MQQNKRFEQSPDSDVSVHRNPVFHVYVWPLRARPLLDTAQVMCSVMFHNAATLTVAGDNIETQPNVFSHSRVGTPSWRRIAGVVSETQS